MAGGPAVLGRMTEASRCGLAADELPERVGQAEAVQIAGPLTLLPLVDFGRAAIP